MSGGNSGAIRVWRALGRSCGGCWSLLEGGLGRSPGEGPAGGAEGRLKGRGGLSITGLAGEMCSTSHSGVLREMRLQQLLKQ